MARNIEIKARLPQGIEALRPAVRRIAGVRGPERIAQDDTFFPCAQGRLKLRAFSAHEGELIFYQRTDEAGPKASFYVRSPTASPDTLREVLTLAHGGVSGRVRKRRELWLAGRTRIHLDAVEGLGQFLELEVVLKEGEDEAAGVAEAQALLQQLGIDEGQLLRGAYVDLLTAAA